jgi:hypothetical protein
LQKHTDRLAKVASDRVSAISQIRSVLWTALAALFDKGSAKDKFSDSAKNKASDFSKPFEQAEDARFFIALNEEIESEQPDNERLQWLLSMADAAEAILKQCIHRRTTVRRAALPCSGRGLIPIPRWFAKPQDAARPGQPPSPTIH